MRLRSAGGFDLLTGVLLLGGAALLAVAIVAAVVLLAPPRAPESVVALEPEPTALPTPGRTSAALPADRVAAVLTVDASQGAAAATRQGDHVDVLAYFSPRVTGDQSITRVLLADVPVLSVDRAGSSVGLTLAVPQDSALLLQEAQALGGQPFVTLRSPQSSPDLPPTFSDADLASRLAAGAH
jgi:Flp pilus assembly protein CpaB